MSETNHSQVNPAWCIVANVVHEHLFGEQHEMRKGTKHFAPGAQVHCVQFHWDADFTRVEVVGRHRKSKRLIKVWMRPAYLANWRVKLEYHPQVIRFLTNYSQAYTGNGHETVNLSWDGTEASKTRAEEIVNGWLPQTLGAGDQPFNTRKKSKSEGSPQQ